MTSISTNNSINFNATYTTSSSKQSEISSLQKERNSLQQELQSLQSELYAGGSSTETKQAEIEAIQVQITTIDSQIARLEAEKDEKSSISKTAANDKNSSAVVTENKEDCEFLKSILDDFDLVGNYVDTKA